MAGFDKRDKLPVRPFDWPDSDEIGSLLEDSTSPERRARAAISTRGTTAVPVHAERADEAAPATSDHHCGITRADLWMVALSAAVVGGLVSGVVSVWLR
jgi:hypothetical protein